MRSFVRWFSILALTAGCTAMLAAVPALARGDVGASAVKQDIPQIAAADLPRDARDALRLIKRGGPFPYARDGAVFNNRERLLPARSRGYYREYTVQTPGARDRGPRRIIAGGRGEYYYTDDHYASFRRIGF
ncbi:MAG: hypothetical protein A3F74_12040 [Betaproteobacteria bacterium RIFCSPLOWO2_12_FULL_62_58]|nr:MAG: hypothetical protein A3I62_04650 [Betaproteobacteria bacterium RIFCSPLOWO2_02_FULL_62_79]OGA53161.1 MAG: hypothetical protein A3F74_12040 [Betaproteobacteria bacterium RIFCSPLOWO2_12_FULL_62_58]